MRGGKNVSEKLRDWLQSNMLTVLKQELVVANFVTETSKFCDNLSRYFALFCP
jgi:hypothetical protein